MFGWRDTLDTEGRGVTSMMFGALFASGLIDSSKLGEGDRLRQLDEEERTELEAAPKL